MTQKCEGRAHHGHDDASELERSKGAGSQDPKLRTDTLRIRTATEYLR